MYTVPEMPTFENLNP